MKLEKLPIRGGQEVTTEKPQMLYQTESSESGSMVPENVYPLYTLAVQLAVQMHCNSLQNVPRYESLFRRSRAQNKDRKHQLKDVLRFLDSAYYRPLLGIRQER